MERIRTLTVLSSASVAVGLLVARVASAATLVQPSFFGTHLSTATLVPYPAPPNDTFATQRVWDITELRSGRYVSVQWQFVNPSSTVYDWTQLDAVVKTAQAHGKDILYTLGGSIPGWASTHPTGGGCAYGDGTCFAPTAASWVAFVTAVTARYDGTRGRGKIRYWELWNEPNAQNFWGETMTGYADMVVLAEAAYPIIKAAAPDNLVISPAPQGTNAHRWLDIYFAAGGDRSLDVIGFHSYLVGAPELVTTLVADVQAVQAKYPSLSGKPLWDTEHGWGDDFTPANAWPFSATDDQQAAWIARFLPLSVASGISRSFWYLWDGYEGQPHWGWLFDRNTKTLRRPGIAYNTVYHWLVHATLDRWSVPTGNGDGVGQCHLTRPGGFEGLIVWAASAAPSFTTRFTVPAQYATYRTLDGLTVPTSGGNVLTLTMKPILLEH